MLERSPASRLAFPVARTLVPCLFVVSFLCLAPSGLGLVGSARATEPLYSCGLADAFGAQNIFTAYSTFGINYFDYCGDSATDGMGLYQDGVHSENPGQVASWYTTAPAGLVITNAVALATVGAGDVGTGYEAYFYWTGGSQRVTSANGAFASAIPNAATFGWLLECNPSGTVCPPNGGPPKTVPAASIEVYDVQLTVAETVNPSVTALGGNNLWYKGASEYVRGGGWSVAYSAGAPSGIDSMGASENGQAVSDPTTLAPGCTPNHTVWQQCAGTQTWSPTISLSGNGDQQLALGATSAAGNSSSPTETIHVDNTEPTVALTGASQASSAGGTQYVTATASVGPSGLGWIDCSVDAGPAHSYTSSPAQIPVSGLGLHVVRCTASNRAYSSAGQVAVSAPATFSMDIAQPTVSGITFANIIHGLKCRQVKERRKVSAKWVTVRRHGELITVHRRARTKVVKAMKCRERIRKRKVTEVVKVKRHGKTVLVRRTKIEKVAVPPRVVNEPTKRVAFGKGTTVTGILVTTDGTALGGRTVQVLTAPNNQLNQWSQADIVTTSAEGTWTATLPPGPARLVEASYAGDSTTLPSVSSTVKLVVPARIAIRINPRRLPWSGVVTIRGHLEGGYVPPDGVPLYLEIGLPLNHRPYKPVPFRTNANGAFSIQWSWGSGVGVATFPLRVALLGTSSDFPYVASSSKPVKVTFGLAAPKATTKPHHKRNRRRRKRRR